MHPTLGELDDDGPALLTEREVLDGPPVAAAPKPKGRPAAPVPEEIQRVAATHAAPAHAPPTGLRALARRIAVIGLQRLLARLEKP